MKTETESRKNAILRLLPTSAAQGIGGRPMADSLSISMPQLRYCLDALWTEDKIEYSGNTRARVYWRTCSKPKA